MTGDDVEQRHPVDFEAGREAARSGRPYRSNPIKGDADRRLAWNRGYNAEREELALAPSRGLITLGDVRRYIKALPDNTMVKRTKTDHTESGTAALCLDIMMDHLEAESPGRPIKG